MPVSRNEEFSKYVERTGEIGFVEMVMHPIVHISGLPLAKVDEVVMFETGEMGQVISTDLEAVEVLVFSKIPIHVGEKVSRTELLLEVPVGDELFGHTIDPLGYSLYKEKPLKRPKKSSYLNVTAPGIDKRKKITQPLETGVAIVDLMVPLGKGQRELVIGDRKTGKTKFILQTVLSQAKKGSVCIYGAIGKKKIEIRQVQAFIEENKIANNSLIVASSPSDSVGMIFLTPYSAMAIAEYFRDQGRDVLLILDDLSTHAKFYREISLIARRFPGRNSYPGDIFFTHSRLLERAGNFINESGGETSITCLPVCETIEGDISGYIQTNLMSMTDGHIYFDKDLFAQGRIPPVNYFLSVTRVGRQTQSQIRWGINRELNTFLTLFEKTERFVHFGAELNVSIKTTLEMGERIIKFFGQHMDIVLPINLQIILFSLIWVGTWNNKSKESMGGDIKKIVERYTTDATYKGKVDQIIEGAKDFNTLLAQISGKSEGLIYK